MKHIRKHLCLGLALLALFSFCLLFLGGNFLHNHIHHHDTSQSLEECPFSQLLTQSLLLLIVLLTALVLKNRPFSFTTVPPFVSKTHQFFPNLRAPPVIA